MDYYHGTPIEALPSILENGLCPCLGAGSDAVMAHFGMTIPGVYVSRSWQVAKTYPMFQTTGPVKIPGQKKEIEIAGGSIVANDGTRPLRAVVRCVARPSNRLWHRDSNQDLFMPKDLFITNVYFIA